MNRFRMVALAAVAFAVSSFGSLVMADCGGRSSCGGRTGLLARMHAKKAACGGGLMAKLQARKAAKCSAAPSCSAPAPAPACGCESAPAPACGCESAPVSTGCGCGGSVYSDSGMVGSVVVTGAAPCSNCGTTLDAGSVTTSSSVPPAPTTPTVAPAAAPAAAPAVPAAPTTPAVPEAPVSASDVPKA
jgi:hypothetical protein